MASDKATWLAPDDPRNPFGVELLDLMVTQTVIAASQDPDVASRSISWGSSDGAELDIAPVAERPAIACSLRLPIDRSLPDGFLFTPSSMDEKWVLAWRNGTIIAARSWTGTVDTIADAHIDGSTLVIERIRASESSPLTMYGDLPSAFEWLLRSHALGEKLPFPVSPAGATLFENAPLSSFSAFGNVIFCAVRSWTPPPPSKPLRSDGRVLRSLRAGKLDDIERAIAEGEDIDAPSTDAGYTALHLAIVRGHTEAVTRLVALGADPNRRADRGMYAIGMAIVHEAPPELFAALERAGCDLFATNDDGFSTLHAACETGNAWAVRWLVERGHGLEPRTKRGHTPLQIACALGHLDAAQTMVELGADLDARSNEGTALDIARSQGKADVVTWIERRRG